MLLHFHPAFTIATPASIVYNSSDYSFGVRPMKRRIAFAVLAGCLTLITLANFASADSTAPTKKAESKITHVTVYPGNALITREVVVPEGTGLMEIVVNPLPPQ